MSEQSERTQFKYTECKIAIYVYNYVEVYMTPILVALTHYYVKQAEFTTIFIAVCH